MAAHIHPTPAIILFLRLGSLAGRETARSPRYVYPLMTNLRGVALLSGAAVVGCADGEEEEALAISLPRFFWPV